MTEKVLAGIVIAICAVMLLRMLLGHRRHAFDAAGRRVWMAWRRVWIVCRIKALRLWHWRAAREQASRDAEEAIRRAREGEWDGNVYKPKSFKGPRKLH